MDCGDWLRKRTSRLMFWAWAGRCQEELLANKLHSTQAQATKSDLILEFCEQRFHLLSLPLCVREARRVCQVSRALPGGLMDVNGKILQRRAGALRSTRARPTTFAGPEADVGTLRSIVPTLVG